MIRFASLKALTDNAIYTVSRYKLPTFIALLKTVLLIWLNEKPSSNGTLSATLTRLAFVAALALPLALAILLSEERKQWQPYFSKMLAGLVTILLAIYYLTMDSEPNLTQTYRFAIFWTGAHLLVSYAPFIGTNDKEGFWQYNKSLFLQFLNASLYSGTLYVGLLVAVQTVKYLFNVTYPFSIELDLFIVASTFFHTIFFLSKIAKPGDPGNDYPVGLKIFTQYVLLPLVVIYVTILYVYEAKIVVQWQLPQGQVAYLVLAFSIAGIFALLLLYPLSRTAGERWITIFSRRYYLTLLPLIVLLFTGIFRRINDYGVTENRYIVAVLAFWLAGITLYFLSGKRDDIRWIPITLSALCFVLPIGPWNIFTVSKNSQLEHFVKILKRNNILNAKSQISQVKKVAEKEREQLTSIIDFFRNRELTGLEPYFAGFNERNPGDYGYYAAMEATLNEYVLSDKQKDSGTYTSFSPRHSGNEASVSLIGFEHALFIDPNQNDSIADQEIEIRIEDSGKRWILHRNGDKVVVWDVAARVSALRENYEPFALNVPQDSLIFTHGKRYKMVLRSLSSSNENCYGSGILFYK